MQTSRQCSTALHVASGDFGHEHQFCVLSLDGGPDTLSVVQILLLCSCRIGNFMTVGW